MSQLKDIFERGRQFQAYAGTDMIAYINNKPVASMEQVTVSISREAAPRYVMGKVGMVTLVRGKRAIVGTMQFSTFDRHSLLYDVFGTEDGTSQPSLRDLYAEAAANKFFRDSNGTDIKAAASAVLSAPTFQQNALGANLEAHYKYLMDTKRVPRYVDQLPPFNVTMTMVNDSGSASHWTLYGVYLLNEAFGYSQEDLNNAMACTYIATEVDPLETSQKLLYAINR